MAVLSALLILKHYCVDWPSSEIRILASSMQENFVHGNLELLPFCEAAMPPIPAKVKNGFQEGADAL
jgi:hypothetical protein